MGHVAKTFQHQPPANEIKCHLCEQVNPVFPKWDVRKWACKPCWPDYVRFRRYFKKEFGRYPTVKEFLSDD